MGENLEGLHALADEESGRGPGGVEEERGLLTCSESELWMGLFSSCGVLDPLPLLISLEGETPPEFGNPLTP